MVTKTSNGRLLVNPSYPPKISGSGKPFAPVNIASSSYVPPDWQVAIAWVLKDGHIWQYPMGRFSGSADAEPSRERLFPGNPYGVSGDYGGRWYNKFFRAQVVAKQGPF
jgi:hypothetical protein